MKVCPRCNKEKQETEFASSGKRLNSYCKDCQREYCRQHYVVNKSEHNKRRYKHNKKNREDHRSRIKSIKENQPCVDCGKSYPYYVMQFDHLEDKVENVANMPGHFGWDKIESEIAKCELVCANCHCERTYKRSIGQR